MPIAPEKYKQQPTAHTLDLKQQDKFFGYDPPL